MRILIDIGHPAHVHLFKNFAHKMISKGNEVLFTCRDKEFEIELLEYNGFNYVSFGKKHKGTIGKIWGMFKFDFREWKVCLKFKPDILLSHGSIYAAHTAFLIGKPHISFEDTFNFEQIRLYKPFTETILTSDYDNPLKKDKKTIQYAGYHELAYLHKNQFTPASSVLKELGLEKDDKYVIVRFVAWNASHDIGHKGISYENKIKAITEFSKYGRVFISSETQLPKDLEKYRIKIKSTRMHDAIAFASLMYGESSTMSEEASLLGTPAVHLNNSKIVYTQELENKYDLMYNFTESEDDQRESIKKGVELLKLKNTKEMWINKANNVINDKIDVSAFLTWFIEEYPESKKRMKENPDYQYRFK